jgi:hypothetical protein
MHASEHSRRWLGHEWNVIVVIAFIAALGVGWLGWEANVVRHRRAMREQIEAGGGAVFGVDISWPASPLVVQIRPADSGYSISRIRGQFGDEPIALIGFDRQLTASDREAIEAFPEAQVHGLP